MANNSNNQLGTSKKINLLMVALGVIFGVLVLIIGYYIVSSDRRSIPLQPLHPAHTVKPTTPPVNSSPTVPKITDAPVGFEKIGDGEPQVYHIENNIYTYENAKIACTAHGAELATYEQLLDAYKNGADWCSYGWHKGQLALYPTQKKTWLKMQENDADKRDQCGEVGINGGYFENKDMLFGATCYGVKPAPRPHEKIKREIISDSERELLEKVAQYKKSKMDKDVIHPFNEDKWATC